MNDKRVAIPLNSASNTTRPIKTGALAVFKAVRWLGQQGAKTPDRLARVRTDIAEAWAESRPTV
jgi:hypothetical protein